MEPTIILVVVIVVLLAVVAWLLYERQRSARLQSTFGPEYKRAVAETGDRRAAEAELEERQRRVRALEIRPLAADERERYAAAWREVQGRFVDDPAAAIADADRLIGEVMEARGYPVADFERRTADISVDHPAVVEHYRAAHAIASRSDGEAETEDLRQAMVHYRALFEDLLEPTSEQPGQATAERAPDADLRRKAS
jgi:hypothetical protein